MPPTGGSGRRGMLPPGESQYAGKAMTYVGMAAAALGAIAGGFNLYEKHKDQFISGPPRSMPRRIERQILAGSSPDDDEDDDDSSPMLTMGNGGRKSWRNTTSSRAVAGSEDLSSEHLCFIQKEYKEELVEINEEGDWEVCLIKLDDLAALLRLCRTCLLPSPPLYSECKNNIFSSHLSVRLTLPRRWE